jgi:hypothetical protein
MVHLRILSFPVLVDVLQFHVVVGLVEKPDKPVNLVSGFLAESHH